MQIVDLRPMPSYLYSYLQGIVPSLDSLRIAAGYHFDGQGKAFRPMIIMLMAMAFNQHNGLAENRYFMISFFSLFLFI